MNSTANYFKLGKTVLFIVAIILVAQTFFTFNAISFSPEIIKSPYKAVESDNKQTDVHLYTNRFEEKNSLKIPTRSKTQIKRKS